MATKPAVRKKKFKQDEHFLSFKDSTVELNEDGFFIIHQNKQFVCFNYREFLRIARMFDKALKK